MLRLGDAIELLGALAGANLNITDRINQVCERYLKSTDCVGSLERVTFTVTADADGQGFITLPERYDGIRGAVIQAESDSTCGAPLSLRNGWYEYTPGNLGMISSSDGLRGIIPIPMSNSGESGFSPLRRYKVPVCPAVGSVSYFTCICKRAFTMITDDNAILPVQNVGALKIGLKALDKEDAEDWRRATELWVTGKTLLAEEIDNSTGSEALGKVAYDDDFELSALGCEYGWGWGGDRYYG